MLLILFSSLATVHALFCETTTRYEIDRVKGVVHYVVNYVSGEAASEVQGSDIPTFEERIPIPSQIIPGQPKRRSHGTCAEEFAKDAKFVYYRGKRLQGADPKTFTRLGPTYSVSGRIAFFDDRAIPSVDVNTFKSENSRIAKDKNNVYVEGEAYPLSTYKDFRPYDIAGKKAWWMGKPLEGVDVESFEVLKKSGNSDYAKDNHAVYLRDKKIDGADPKTFKVPK